MNEVLKYILEQTLTIANNLNSHVASNKIGFSLTESP